MADVSSLRTDVFDSLAFPANAVLRIEAVPAMARFAVRGREPIVAAVEPALGFALPTGVCRAETAGERAALWLGPDEWLVLAPAGEQETLEAGLAAALAGHVHALVDVSHRNVGLVVSGPKAAVVLNHGCPLDLSLAAFPQGMCTRTVLGKAEIVLWRTGADTFRLECWRSFHGYVAGFLKEAALEFS